MAVELVTFKLDNRFLNEVDSIVKRAGYSSRTDFIRDALRKQVNDIKNQEAYIRLGRLRGAAPKRNLSHEQVHKIREKALKSLLKKKGLSLD